MFIQTFPQITTTTENVQDSMLTSITINHVFGPVHNTEVVNSQDYINNQMNKQPIGTKTMPRFSMKGAIKPPL